MAFQTAVWWKTHAVSVEATALAVRVAMAFQTAVWWKTHVVCAEATGQAAEVLFDPLVVAHDVHAFCMPAALRASGSVVVA
jgi:hypothetical protein